MLFSEKNNKYRENTYPAQLPGDLWGLHRRLKPASWFCRQQHLTPRGKRPGGETQGHRFFLLLPQFGRARAGQGCLAFQGSRRRRSWVKSPLNPRAVPRGCALASGPGTGTLPMALLGQLLSSLWGLDSRSLTPGCHSALSAVRSISPAAGALRGPPSVSMLCLQQASWAESS